MYLGIDNSIIYCYLTLDQNFFPFLSYDPIFGAKILKITLKWKFIIFWALWPQFSVKNCQNSYGNRKLLYIFLLLWHLSTKNITIFELWSFFCQNISKLHQNGNFTFFSIVGLFFINQAQISHGSCVLLLETLLLFMHRPKNNSNFEL